jgi:hypothetical protein
MNMHITIHTFAMLEKRIVNRFQLYFSNNNCEVHLKLGVDQYYYEIHFSSIKMKTIYDQVLFFCCGWL